MTTKKTHTGQAELEYIHNPSLPLKQTQIRKKSPKPYCTKTVLGCISLSTPLPTRPWERNGKRCCGETTEHLETNQKKVLCLLARSFGAGIPTGSRQCGRLRQETIANPAKGHEHDTLMQEFGKGSTSFLVHGIRISTDR
jgi:hypothetical protein